MNGDKPEKPGFKEVIDSVDGASSKELAVLTRIEKGLAEGFVPGGSTTAKEASDTNLSRSVQLNQQRKAQNDKKRRKNAKKQSKNNHRSDEEQKNTDIDHNSTPEPQKTIIRQPKNNHKNNNPQNKSTSEKSQSNTNQKATIKQEEQEALNILRSPVRQGAERDTKGRFTSRDKVDSDKEGRNQDRHEKAQEESARKQNALLTRVGKIISEMGDPMDADSTNAAGTAAGGSFWKAGQEAYTMAKNVGGGAIGAGKKMKEVMGGGEDENGERKPGLLRRAFSRKKNSGSQNVIARQIQKQQVDATEKQTEQIKEGNKEITDRLDELLDKQGGGGGGKGMWGTLGGMFGKAITKPIQMVGKLLSKVLLSPFIIAAAVMKTAFTLGKKILQKVMAMAAGAGARAGFDDLADGSLPERSRKRPKKKNRPTKKAKKPNLLKRLFKNKGVQVATGLAATTATGYAASEVADHFTGEEGAEGKKATGKPAEKTLTDPEKLPQKETKALAKAEATKVAEKGAVNVAEKGATDVAEKGALKLAEKGGEKLALKAGATVAAKAAGKVALRSIPIVGQIAGAGIDAVTGWMDTEGQQETFGLKPDQKVSARQKTEYTAANVLDMGGLVSGAAGLLSSGASALGMDGVAKALDFDTGDIAKLIDKRVSSTISTVKSVTDAIGITKKDPAEQKGDDKKADERTGTVVDAIKKGAADTIDALNKIVGKGVAAVASPFKSTPDSGPVSAGGIKTPKPSKTGKMQLDTMAGKFAALEQQHGLPAGLLRAVATTESGGDNGAVSGAGAKGMFQFMPATAKEYGLVGEDVYDPDKSATAAAKKLSGLMKRYNGDVGLALSAYNWGEGNIQRKGMGAAPKETREYAPKVFAAMQAAGAVAPTTSINYAKAEETAGQQAQQAKVVEPTGTGIDPRFTPGKLPTDEESAKSIIGGGLISTAIDAAGGDKVRYAEGIRHQVSAETLLAQQSGQTPQSQQKVKETKEATSQARAAATSMYSRAKLPSDSQGFKDMPGGEFFNQVINKYGGDKVATAEGLRHQASAADIANMQSGFTSASAKPAKQSVQPAALSIPSKLPVVRDMAASQMKPSVNVANEMALPKSLTRTWDSILKRLDEIAGHTKDTAEKTGDKTPKANSPQPAPRSSVPLNVEDPLMSEVASN